MTKNQILCSSDHHANWEALDKLYLIAKEKQIPFVINGDIIGDYNFEELKTNLDLKYPYEIENQILQKNLSNEIFEKYITYIQIKQNGGDPSFLLKQIPEHLQQNAINQLKEIITQIETKEFQNKIKQILKLNKFEPIESEHKIKIKSLYNIIIKFHAKKLAELIEKHQVKTYFLLGNHEPENFVNLTKQNLKPENQHLLQNLGEINKIENANGINIAGVSNVRALMPFLHNIYNESELNKLFPHQLGQNRPILFKNVTSEHLQSSKEHTKDFDWIRIMENDNDKNQELDIFFTHGQIGIGAWRDEKQCNEMPTLHVAAMLSELAKLTVDGHLHTTHQMKNPLNKETIRAVGNKAFILTKTKDNEIQKELLEVDAPYDTRGKINLEHLNIEKEILKEIFHN